MSIKSEQFMKETPQKQYTGTLIAIEGIDGSGKSTLSRLLHAELTRIRTQICLTKEPGATELGREIRALIQNPKLSFCPQADYLLFAADRAEHITTKVLPLLEQGYLVLSDRMVDSSIVYQGYARGVDIHMIHVINRWTMQDIVPDITLYVCVDAQTARNRIIARNEAKTRFEAQPLSFYQKLIEGFNTLYANRNDCIILDGSQSVDVVCAQALQTIITRL